MFNQNLYECINQVEFKQIIIFFYLMLIYLYLYINIYNSFNDISLVLELIINCMQISAYIMCNIYKFSTLLFTTFGSFKIYMILIKFEIK